MPELAEKMYVVESLGALSVLIVVSNVSVYSLVCFNRRLRTYTNWFTLSLAASDILTGAVSFNTSDTLQTRIGGRCVFE